MLETFALGPFLLSTRVLGFVISVLVAVGVTSLLAKRAGIDPARARTTMEGSVIAGLLTARAAHVALNWAAFAPAPWTALYFWQYGYLPVAGLAGGVLYVIYRLRNVRAADRPPTFRIVSMGAAAGAIVLAATMGVINLAPGASVLRAGDTVPDFRLVNLDGNPVSYSSLEGKGVVLNFWATWCPPCRREMPLLESAWRKHQSENVEIVGIDLGESMEDVRRFVDTQGFSYPIWVEPSNAGDETVDTNKMLGWFGSAGVPTTVFIKADGRIDKVYVGELNRSLLQERIPKLAPE